MLFDEPESPSVLAGLDSDQIEAVTAPVGIVVVRAGAGSGKTTVLTRRIIHRISEKSADEQHVLAFTFTRQAGAELSKRLQTLGAGKSITTGTFHAVAYSLLRQRWQDTNKKPRTVLSSRQRLLTQLIPGARNDVLFQVSNEIDWCRARMISAENYASSASASGRRPPLKPGEFEKVLNSYWNEKRKRGVLDMDDLIELTVQEIENDSKYAELVRWRFRHIHVDEAQDMNPLQYSLINALTKNREDLFAVGDPHQSIYGWNGADPKLFDQLAERGGGVHLITLPNNYRCSPTIVEAAKHVLRTQSMESDAVSKGADGPQVLLHNANTSSEEADLIADILNAPAYNHGLTSSAVLVRTNVQIDPIRVALENSGITVRTAAFANTAIAEAMRTVQNATSLEELLDWAQDTRTSTATEMLAELVSEYVVQSTTAEINGTGFQAWVNATGALRDNSNTAIAGEVEILTFHGAKGRQWYRVVIAGCEKGLSPHSSAITHDQLAEEARLIYVAMTRAETELHMTRCLSRNNRNCQPSPWLKGIPLGKPAESSTPPEDLKDIVAKLRDPQRDMLSNLKDWRRGVARVACTTEIQICSDSELNRIAETRPQDEAALAEILGPIQARRHAPKILAITSN